MIFFPSRVFFCFEGIPYTWLKSILCQIPTKKYPPAKKKRKPAPPKEFSHGTPKSMGFSVDVFFSLFQGDPFFQLPSVVWGVTTHLMDELSRKWIWWKISMAPFGDSQMARWRDGYWGGQWKVHFFFFWLAL